MATDTIDRVQTQLDITLFGAFDVLIDGQPMGKLRSRKELWLLALLILRHGKPVSREWLAASLWPDSPESQSLAYLRRAIYLLKLALGDAGDRICAPTTRTLLLDLGDAEVDVIAFDSAVKHDSMASLERAVALYRGPLLEGCDEEWVCLERSSRAAQFVEALEKLAVRLLEVNRAAAAIPHLEIAILLEPYRESLYGLLMRSLASRGDHGAVSHTYRQLRRRLHDDLQSDVSAEVSELYKQLQAEARRAAQPAPAPESPRRPPKPKQGWARPLTRLVGRCQEVTEIQEALKTGRLVTLTGSGGVGKTRLALQIAELQSTIEEVWVVELAAAGDSDAVAEGVLRSLGLAGEGNRTSIEDAIQYLSAHIGLLVLDNCEHLLDVCAPMAKRLLGECPDLRVLTTSRQSLGIFGEVSYPVPPLPAPDLASLGASRPGGLDKEMLPRLMEFESVRLFFERAQAVCPSFRVTSRTAHTVGEICRQLDGIPLAIELAAARCRALSAEQILGRLADRFQLLTGGARAATSHHRTLRALVDWSYDLLTEQERALLNRLSCFSGGWTLDLAEEICSDPQTGGAGGQEVEISPCDVMDILASLVDKSLVLMDHDEIEPRYYLLETIRQYAADRFGACEERDALATKHCATIVALIEKLSKEIRGNDQLRCLQRIDADRSNVRAAFQWAITGKQIDSALRICAYLSDYWLRRGSYLEGIAWCQQALTVAGPGIRTAIKARALTSYGLLLWSTGDPERSLKAHEEALAIREEIGDEHGVAWSQDCLGLVYNSMSDYARARQYHETALAVWRSRGDDKNVSCTLNNLAGLALIQNEYASARAMWEECLQLKRKLVGELEAALPLNNLANLAHAEGDFERSRALHEESLKIRLEYGDKRGIARSLSNMAMVAISDGDWAAARDLTRQGIAGWYEVGNPVGVADGLENLLSIAMRERQHQPETALDRSYHVALFAAAASAIRERRKCPIPANEAPSFERYCAAVKASLPSEKFEEATLRGRTMPYDDVVALALSE